MNKTWLSIGSVLACTLLACGGDEATTIAIDSGGGNDGNVNNDGGGGPDTGKPDGSVDLDGGNPDGSIGMDGGGPDAASFNPGNVNGLVLWLDGAKSVTTKNVNNQTRVTLWGDQTVHKNDAAGSNQQQTFGQNPTSVMSVINSLPAVHFEAGGNQGGGNILTIFDNSDGSLQWGTGDFYLAVVARFNNNPQDGAGRGVGTFYSKWFANGNNTFTGVDMTGNIFGNNFGAQPGMYFSTENSNTNFVTTATLYNDLKPHQFAFQRIGVKLDMRVDGASVQTSNSGGISVDAKNTQVRIGADLFGGQGMFGRLNGDIAEMLAVKGALSSNDQTGLEGYLKTKYGL